MDEPEPDTVRGHDKTNSRNSYFAIATIYYSVVHNACGLCVSRQNARFSVLL